MKRRLLVALLLTALLVQMTAFAPVAYAAPAPKSLTISAATEMISVGTKLKLGVTVEPSNANAKVKWKSSSTSRASVSSSGVVTAKKGGYVTITATSAAKSSVKATFKLLITDPKRPTSITLPSSTAAMNVGDTLSLAPTVLPATAKSSVKFKTSSSSVAAVSSSGVVKAKKAGTVTITAYSSYASSMKATVKITVTDAGKPSKITLTASSQTLDVGDKLQLAAAATPTTAAAAIRFKSSSTKVATVSASGVVTGVKVGTVTITAYSRYSNKIAATVKLAVKDTKTPDAVAISPRTTQLETYQTLQLSATVSPATADASIKWKSSSTGVATVSSSGLVTAKKAGTVTITAYSARSSSVKATLKIKVVAGVKPSSVSAGIPTLALATGNSAQITASASPANASQMLGYASSDSAVLTVGETGIVTAKKAGSATVTVYSRKWSSVKATLRITVYNPSTPTSLKLNTYSTVLGAGDTLTLAATVGPDTASQAVTWASSNSSVATVSADGKVKAEGIGSATITCKTTTGGLSASCAVTVLQTTLATTIPAATTDVSGIALNLAKIEALRRSAVNEALKLSAYSTISASEAVERQAIVNRAFAMFAFPWMTTSTQEYWSSSSAYKRFVTDTVYYGLPYIQTGPSGSYSNRRYNAIKAVNEGYFTSSGKGYYLMSRTKFLDSLYVGSDCSAFVSMAQFGTDHSASYLSTKSIAVSTYYKTVSNWSNLRPGDLLVASGHHTLLFLYFVNSGKSQAMCIEQGGNGNTVNCTIKTLANYSGSGYIARRKTTFAS